MNKKPHNRNSTANKPWRANRPSVFQTHFIFHSIAPVGAHQTLKKMKIARVI